MLTSQPGSLARVRSAGRVVGAARRLASRSTRCAAALPQAGSAAQSSTLPTFHHGVTYTSFEANTFTLKFQTSGARVLVDPWFVGDLTFAEQDWLYRAKKRVIGHSLKVDMEQVASETDVLVLTQGLDDHTHMPTLRQFPKHVPVVANPSAAERIKPLGFKSVRVIDHGQHVDVAGGRLRITATAGALVGPPWSKRQNGLVFRELTSDDPSKPGTSVYFEPHCDFDPASVKKEAPVDVVISPFLSALLGVGEVAYPLVMGDINLLNLCRILKPKVLVPLLNSEVDHSGPLGAVIIDRGSYDAVKPALVAAGLDTRVEWPAPPGEAMSIAL